VMDKAIAVQKRFEFFALGLAQFDPIAYIHPRLVFRSIPRFGPFWCNTCEVEIAKSPCDSRELSNQSTSL
jgi:hypothetical protein